MSLKLKNVLPKLHVELMIIKWGMYWAGLSVFAFSVLGFGAFSRFASNWEVAKQAWVLGCILLFVRCLIATPVWILQKKSASYTFLAQGIILTDMSCVAWALGLPWLISPTADPTLKTFVSAQIAGSFVLHVYWGRQHFDQQWEKLGESALEKTLKNGKINIDTFFRNLNLEPPNVLEPRNFVLRLAIGVAVIALIMLGALLRKIYPHAAGAVFCIPTFMLISWVVQAVALRVFIFTALRRHERLTGEPIHALIKVSRR